MRRVVNPSEVHIVMRTKTTNVYGDRALVNPTIDESGKESITVNVSEYAGNAYYEIPTWVPIWGVAVRTLKSVVFSVSLKKYEAYDKNKVPFVVDVVAFFRIFDFRRAASRIESEELLQSDLERIVQGAVRSVLAHDEIDIIMVERATYGKQFTEAVAENLKEWGLVPVKAIELMDVRDADGEEVIDNIMKQRKSAIEKEARMVVAKNMQEAKEAEIRAEQEVALKEQDKLEVVGKRTAEQQQRVGIAKEQAEQNIQEQKRLTTEKEMDVLRVETVQKAEIAKQETVINTQADQQRQDIEAETAVKVAEKTKLAQTIAAKQRAEVAEKDKDALAFAAEAALIQKQKEAEGQLAQAKATAQGIELQGKAEGEKIRATKGAEADAASKLNEAGVRGQIVLAEQIGTNAGYQNYLIRVRQVEAQETIGKTQAEALGKALEKAGIKIVSTGGGSNDGGGLSSILNLFGPMGASQLNGFLETLEGTELGGKILEKILPKENASTEAKGGGATGAPAEEEK